MTGRTDFWEVVENRRSVRQFEERPIPKEILERVIEAGTRAPNAHNRQSWRFVILTQKPSMERLAEQMGIDFRQALHSSGASPSEVNTRAEDRKKRLTSAPAVVVMCVDTSDLDHYHNQNRDDGEYLMAVQSAAMAGGYMLLAAEALGIAGVWMCAPLFAPHRVQSALNLPAGWVAQGLLLLGYPLHEPQFRPRKPLPEVCRWID